VPREKGVVVLPAAFDYHRPGSLDEALSLLASLGEDAKVLAGGHSLLPAMKLRLAQPAALVDISKIGELRRIDVARDRIAIGAMTTHADLLHSDALASACSLFREAADQIGDLQVRNSGTIGGSLAHADPAADWPAVMLALDAELELASPGGRRTVPAAQFFTDMLQTALAPGEILTEIRINRSAGGYAYVKTDQKASGFALCGVAVAVDTNAKKARVGITGVAPVAYRAAEVERALDGRTVDAAGLEGAARHAADGVSPLGDIHASAEFRAHLARVNTGRALRRALGV
jgi:carbon-monoxide dehydrogenase medium subunit